MIYFLGFLVILVFVVWVVLVEGLGVVVYVVVVLLGVGCVIIFVILLVMMVDFIGFYMNSGVFVYGFMSFLDKVVNGLVVMVI